MRDRDSSGRPRNARPRDELGRPLPTGCHGVEPLPEDIEHQCRRGGRPGRSSAGSGLPFQAHEALEAVWKVASEPERTAWKGMAQLAVALTHAMRGNATGAVRVRERGLLNLAAGELPAVALALRDRLLDLTSGP